MLKVGIVAQDQPDERFGTHKNYLEFAENVGIPVLILPTPIEDFVDIYSKLDVLLLPGGMDVNPNRYTKNISYWTGAANPYLEYFDKEILPALIGKMPIFGICRGLQTLNVHFGGTLKQHLWYHPYSQYETDLVHEVRESGVKGGIKFKVNSFHHQGIDKLAGNFHQELITNDGVIEAISDYGKNIFAVQWHPERLKDQYSVEKFLSIL